MTIADAIKKMMEAWAVLEAEVKKAFPDSSSEEIYQICKAVMGENLGIEWGKGTV